MIWTIYPFKSFYLIIRMVELFLSENSNKFLRTSINNFSKKIYLLLLPFVLPFLQLFKEYLHFILYGSKFPQQELHPLLLAFFSFHRGPVRSCSNCVVSQVPLVHTGLAFLLSLFLFFSFRLLLTGTSYSFQFLGIGLHPCFLLICRSNSAA